ncbi:MAG: TonB-dependent receptor [Gammaproteobacteria bacterium]|nr:TonB-dependent receptor [Gammaproteobacteria bacterium]
MNQDVRIGQTSLTVAVSLALASMFTPVYAQTSDSDEEAPARLEEVVVTSFRRSLENSLELKRESELIVEAVSAEEIGKLPDVSIAESLARLPGLTAQRLNGRGQVISVRGLAPDFTTALLNGRPQVSAGDNRGVEFDQYPSELLSSVVVYKTPDASLIGQGLAGTADLRTIRPLEYGQQAFAGNFRYERNEYDALNAGSTNDGIRYSGSYVDQFRDDTIGLAIGVAHMTNPSQEERFNAWGYSDSDDFAALVVNGTKPFVRSGELERDGLMIVLEAKLSDNLRTAVDVYASNFQETQWLRGIEFPLNLGTNIVGSQTSNGVLTAGTFQEIKGVVRNDVNFRDTQLRAIGWNVEYDINQDWGAEFDFSFSGADRQDNLLETYSGTGPQGEGATDNLGFSLAGEGGLTLNSDLDYTDPDLIRLSSPQGWGGNVVPGGQLGYSNQPFTQDELGHSTLSAKRYLNNAFSSVEFGLNVNRREKTLLAKEFFLALADGSFSSPLPNTTGVTDLSFLGIPGMISYDPLAALRSGIYQLPPNEGQDVVVKSWSVQEDITLGFAQMNLDTIWRNTPVTGNFGLQVVRTDQSSEAFGARPASLELDGVSEGTVTIPLSGGRTYTDVLPSLNVNFEVGDRKFLRVAVARTLARPRMDQLRASETFNFDTSKPCADAETAELKGCDPSDLQNDSPWSRNGGNPQLDPWIANALDISYEQYFADAAGYFAIAGFYKDLESYIFDSQSEEDFTGLPTGDFTPVTNQGLVTRPANGTGGRINGVELAFSLNFDAFWPKLQGFGFVGSASFTDSSIVSNPDDPSTPLPGLSEEVSNLTLFYERGGFTSRISRRERSEFLGEVAGFGNGRNLVMVEGEAIVDAQIGYNFTSGPLSGLSVLLQGNNLTDEPFRTFYNGDSRQVRDFQSYGRTFLLGASFKY